MAFDPVPLLFGGRNLHPCRALTVHQPLTLFSPSQPSSHPALPSSPSGERQLYGNFTPLGQESADVALSFLNLNFRVISAWLCPPGRQPSAPKFMTRSVDVALAGDLDMVEQGSSAGACKVCIIPISISI